MRLVNDLGYGQVSNLDWLLKLILMHEASQRELFLRYFYYLGQRVHQISFFESISSNIEGEQSHLDYIIIFENFISYLIYNILEILWLGIHYNKNTRCLWCLKSKDHIHNISWLCNLIYRLMSWLCIWSCEPIGCQATPRTLGGREYLRTLLWNLSVINYHVHIILHSHETHK